MDQLLKRSPSSYGTYEESVAAIVADVKTRGDEAVFEYTQKFDHVSIDADSIKVTQEEIQLVSLIDLFLRDLDAVCSITSRSMQTASRSRRKRSMRLTSWWIPIFWM
jgi:histidinol dehydrogenase